MFRHTKRQLVRRSLLSLLGAITFAALSAGLCSAKNRGVENPVQESKEAQNQPPGKASEVPVPANEEEIDPNQPLVIGSVINVTVEKEAEPSGSYVIHPAGDILLHIADTMLSITVKGQTTAQAAEMITGCLKTYIRYPHVVVTLIAVPRPVVQIGGAVRISGPVTISSTTTLADVVSRAEWTANANLAQVRLVRRTLAEGREKIVVLTLHLDTYMRPELGIAPDEAQNPVLQNKDSIFVPFKSLAAKGVITISGAVNKPQTDMPLRANPPLTLREAISLSGGITADADRKKVTVRRAGTDQPILIDLDKAEQNDPTANLTLMPNDSVYVERLDAALYYTIHGGVTKGGKFPFDRPITLTQALMTAGGLSPFAHDKQGYILRCPDGVHTHVINFNWQQILAGKAGDIALKPGDNVWIAPGVPGRSMDFFGILSTLGSLRLLF